MIHLTPVLSFSILCEHLPPSQRSGTSPDDSQPVTSLTLLGGERPLCVVGTQAGCVLLCDLTDPSKHDPVVRAFKGHQGAVTSLSTHPSTPLVFASCGQDREIHVYHLNKVRGDVK